MRKRRARKGKHEDKDKEWMQGIELYEKTVNRFVKEKRHLKMHTHTHTRHHTPVQLGTLRECITRYTDSDA